MEALRFRFWVLGLDLFRSRDLSSEIVEAFSAMASPERKERLGRDERNKETEGFK